MHRENPSFRAWRKLSAFATRTKSVSRQLGRHEEADHSAFLSLHPCRIKTRYANKNIVGVVEDMVPRND